MSVHSASPKLDDTKTHFEVLQEDDRVASKFVLAVLAFAIVVTLFAIWIQSRLLASRRAALGARTEAAASVAPREIDGIHQTLMDRDRHGLDLRAQQRASLTLFSWVDRDRGLARIPIDDAIDWLLAHPESATSAGTTAPSASTSTGGAP